MAELYIKVDSDLDLDDVISEVYDLLEQKFEKIEVSPVEVLLGAWEYNLDPEQV